jgi:adenine-specific DNA-methyltransferase
MMTRRSTRDQKQVELAQYFTPKPIADFMASLFDAPLGPHSRILDPGAGEGALGLSLLRSRATSPQENISAVFVEIDPDAREALIENIKVSQRFFTGFNPVVRHEDYLTLASELYSRVENFSHIILNPPYFKLRSDSAPSRLLRSEGIATTNIYAAFVWLSLRLLADDGELVAIIPRSFCNGPYFLKFREYVLSQYNLTKIHLFNSRAGAFIKDGVLQENVIVHLKKQKRRSQKVSVTYSNGYDFEDLSETIVDYDQIVQPNDKHKIIHIPAQDHPHKAGALFDREIGELGISVSTGPVVDFRLENYIRKERGDDVVVPLIYPAHTRGFVAQWPVEKLNKRGQYIIDSPEINKWFVPLDGYYVSVRRFSSKEERRRIFATLIDPSSIDARYVAFENHVNFFHIKKSGMDREFALGLVIFLNSTPVDRYFRSFSGHTQVNVTDLKKMRYPSTKVLHEMGAVIQDAHNLNEELIDTIIRRFE